MTSLPGDPPHWQHCHHISSSVWPGLSPLGDSPMHCNGELVIFVNSRQYWHSRQICLSSSLQIYHFCHFSSHGKVSLLPSPLSNLFCHFSSVGKFAISILVLQICYFCHFHFFCKYAIIRLSIYYSINHGILTDD